MEKSRNNAEINEIGHKLNQLDLDPIKIKLMDSDEGEGWTREQADTADILYRRYLFLMAAYPDKTIVPNKTVDKFWHAHILDTYKYAADCKYVFGEFIHHFPYLGLRGETDKSNLESSFNETKQLFQDLFGEPMSNEELADYSSCKSEGNCWPASCTSKCNVKRTIDTDRPTFGEDSTGTVNIFAKIFHEELA